MDTIITGRKFSMIEDREVRQSLVLKEERDLLYDLEHERVERSYDKIVFDGKTIHGIKI